MSGGRAREQPVVSEDRAMSVCEVLVQVPSIEQRGCNVLGQVQHSVTAQCEVICIELMSKPDLFRLRPVADSTKVVWKKIFTPNSGNR